jgi:hypothetical protein
MSISDADLWHQVHAQREDGVAAMFLIRDLEPRLDQPQIFVVQMPYPVTDLSRLPDAAGYRRLDAFQERWIEPACEALGWTFVAWKSEDGSFFLYLYGGGDPNELLDKLAPFDDALGFFNDRDADWSEYAALRELVDQAEAADDEDPNGTNHAHIHTDDHDHAHDHAHGDHDHHHHAHAHDHDAPVTDPVIKRPGRTSRADTVGERPSNRPVKQPAATTAAASPPRNKPAPTRLSATKKPVPTRSAAAKKVAATRPAVAKKASATRPAAARKASATKSSAKKPSPIKAAKPKPRAKRR